MSMWMGGKGCFVNSVFPYKNGRVRSYMYTEPSVRAWANCVITFGWLQVFFIRTLNKSFNPRVPFWTVEEARMIKCLSLIVLKICQNMLHPLKSMLNTLLLVVTVSLAQAVVPVLNNSTAKRTLFQHLFNYRMSSFIVIVTSPGLVFALCAIVTFV